MSATVARILIVDDEMQNRKLLEALLRPEGYVTQTAANGEDALAAVAESAPDLVLLDAMMPGMDGFEVATRLKAEAATSNIPVIMVTAMIDKESRLAGLKAGAEDFLTKPVDRAELWLRVRNLLRLKAYGDLLRNQTEILEQQVRARTADLQRFGTAMDATTDAIYLVDRSTMRFIHVNDAACRIQGLTRGELLAQPPWDVLAASRAALELSYDGVIAAGADTRPLEILQERKDGSQVWVELRRHAQRSGDGWMIVTLVRDITSRKETDALLARKMDELRRSNEELEQFAYVASHDLQEPLRMVASYTSLLSRRYQGKLDSNADEFIAYAVDGATRMQGLIKDLLDYSRVGTKGRDLADISSEEALSRALSNLRGAIEDSGALVTQDPLPRVMADPMQLIQLFQNLIGNAIKYQNTGVPRIHVSARKDAENKWLFSVQDNGLGIDPRHHEKIFVMFQRLHGRGEFSGTGIGLAICKRIVARHGSTITVDSELGHGATFRFALAGGISA